MGLSLGQGLSYASMALTPGQGDGVWTPAAISPSAWYDPSDLSTMFKDTAGTTPVTADGDLVARINDKSGSGNHLLQATSSRRPIYRTSGGLSWLESDGVDDFLQSSLSGWADLTAVVAHACFNVGTGRLLLEIAAASRADALCQMDLTSETAMRSIVRGAAFVEQASAGTAFTMGMPYIRSLKAKQNDFQFWWNGVSLAADMNGVWPAAAPATLSFFAGQGGAGSSKERLFGAVIRTPVMDNAARQQVEAYLAVKAGVSL